MKITKIEIAKINDYGIWFRMKDEEGSVRNTVYWRIESMDTDEFLVWLKSVIKDRLE